MYKPRERDVMKMMFCLSNVGFLVATIENRASHVGCDWHTCVVWDRVDDPYIELSFT